MAEAIRQLKDSPMKPVARTLRSLVWLLLPLSVGAHAAGTSFVDGLDAFDSSRWTRTHGVAAPDPIDVGWRSSHVSFGSGEMSLRLNTWPCSVAQEQCAGQPNASGQLVSNDSYGFGTYSATFRAASGAGVVTDFMKYSGTLNVATGPTDLIGMHIAGNDTSTLFVSYLSSTAGLTTQAIALGFDASAGMHTYAFSWVAGSLSWSVDGQSVHTLSGVDVPDEQGRIVADVWAVESGSATSVLGSYVRGGATATFDSISYTAVSPVPEPAPMAMLFAGLGVLGWQQRRRNRTSA